MRRPQRTLATLTRLRALAAAPAEGIRRVAKMLGRGA